MAAPANFSCTPPIVQADFRAVEPWGRARYCYSITLKRLSTDAVAKAVKLSATAYGNSIVRS